MIVLGPSPFFLFLPVEEIEVQGHLGQDDSQREGGEIEDEGSRSGRPNPGEPRGAASAGAVKGRAGGAGRRSQVGSGLGAHAAGELMEQPLPP